MTHLTSGLFTSLSPHWATPKAVYRQLDSEFDFNDDPCPLHGDGGLDENREWGSRTFINPPYGNAIVAWVRRAYDESLKGKLVVCLLPSRTDTRWWHDYVMKASQIRFIKGRLHFSEAGPAPFPSAIVVFGERG